MEETSLVKRKEHNLNMESRERLYISGVLDVSNFNDNTVAISTQIGGLIIKGDDLHISSLNINEGNLLIKGFIRSCIYTDNKEYKKEKGFFKSVFK